MHKATNAAFLSNLNTPASASYHFKPFSSIYGLRLFPLAPVVVLMLPVVVLMLPAAGTGFFFLEALAGLLPASQLAALLSPFSGVD